MAAILCLSASAPMRKTSLLHGRMRNAWPLPNANLICATPAAAAHAQWFQKKKKKTKKLLTRCVGGKAPQKKCLNNLRDAYRENVASIPGNHMPRQRRGAGCGSHSTCLIISNFFPRQASGILAHVVHQCQTYLQKREREREMNKNVSQIAGKTHKLAKVCGMSRRCK